MTTIITKDIVIFGGGIAGLWQLNRLRNEGYDAILFDQSALGTGQSIASQGMIHGGIKYALGGLLNSASNAIADMPAHWRACLQGSGDVDLRDTKVLSEQYYMWPKNNMRSKISAFLGSKAVRGKVDHVATTDFPLFFQGKITGPLYQLNDIVLDVPSLLKTLANNHHQHIHQLDWSKAALRKDKQGAIQSLILPDNNHATTIEVHAQRYLFSSGCGTTNLLNKYKLAPTATQAGTMAPFDMQLRPLQMVMLKHDIPNPVYVHCVSDQLTSTPEVTITSHQCADGKWVWYLGGELAESGAKRTPAEQVEAAKNKLLALFPWCDFSNAHWQTLFIDRAEAKQKNAKRPEHASIFSHQNIYVCWPTKLTLAPSLANSTLELLAKQNIVPSTTNTKPKTGLLDHLPFPEIAAAPWSKL